MPSDPAASKRGRSHRAPAPLLAFLLSLAMALMALPSSHALAQTGTFSPQEEAPPPTPAPQEGAPPPKTAPGKAAPPPTPAPGKGAPQPKTAPGKEAPPPTPAPDKGEPQPKTAPGKGEPQPKTAPGKAAPPPKTATGEGVPQPGLATELDALLASKVGSGELMGVVVMVSKDGLLVYQGAAGFADKEAGRPMTADAVFRLASVSKAYTTMAAGALIGRGVIGIDEPIGTYLPAFSGSNAELKDKRALGIKVRHLLSHQAGFNYTFGESPGGPYHAAGVADGCQGSPGLSLDENMLRLSRTPLLYAPGTKHAYSVASDVLGAVIQNATGKPLPDAMDELVLSPLGITDTGYLAKDPGKLTAHYRSRPGGPRRMAEPELFGIGGGKTLTLSPKRATDPTEFPSGGCGMVGSAPSLMVLLEAMREDGGGIVEPAVMSGFYQDAIAPQRNSPGEGFGASWAVVLNPAAAGLPVSAGTIHWGGVYGHNWYVDRENGLSVVILTNTALKGLNGDTKDRALTAIYKAYPKGK